MMLVIKALTLELIWLLPFWLPLIHKQQDAVIFFVIQFLGFVNTLAILSSCVWPSQSVDWPPLSSYIDHCASLRKSALTASICSSGQLLLRMHLLLLVHHVSSSKLMETLMHLGLRWDFCVSSYYLGSDLVGLLSSSHYTFLIKSSWVIWWPWLLPNELLTTHIVLKSFCLGKFVLH